MESIEGYQEGHELQETFERDISSTPHYTLAQDVSKLVSRKEDSRLDIYV